MVVLRIVDIIVFIGFHHNHGPLESIWFRRLGLYRTDYTSYSKSDTVTALCIPYCIRYQMGEGALSRDRARSSTAGKGS